MEDALVPWNYLSLHENKVGLNPCFNGRCTRTIGINIPEVNCFDSLNPCFNGRCTRT